LKSILKIILAFTLYYSGAICILRFLGRHNAKILLYHSVNNNKNEFIQGLNLTISSTTFKKHLRYLQRHYQIMPLKNLVHCLNEKYVPKRAIVITFDDGFADNYRYAYPLLKRDNIPATIFLCTDCIGKKGSIWIQDLNYLINTCGATEVFNKIQNVNGFNKKCQILVGRNQNNDVAKNMIDAFAYSVQKETRDNIIENLYAELNLKKKQLYSNNQVFLNWRQVSEMHRNGISFGNHGASHTPLSAMSIEEEKNEIENSHNIIQKNLKQNFLPFAYPFGTEKAYNAETKKIVKRANHDCILTARQTKNVKGTSPFDLGRINISEMPVYYLAFELEKHILKRIPEFCTRRRFSYARPLRAKRE
jgi:peptidoglycan/xylan/chitin deacetylase (PgdA/CDA1 family)